MRVAHLDPFGGLAGDMLLGALLDLRAGSGQTAGAIDREMLLATLRSIDLPGWRWQIDATQRRALACTKVEFCVADDRDHRHLPQIVELIERSSMGPRAKRQALAAFDRLALAEARAHGIDPSEVHFHEVGAADAILDICAVSIALDALAIERIHCGPLPGGSGTVKCAHGEMPCPVPAVVNLLQDYELQLGLGRGEMVTPTGAALLATWGEPLASNRGAGTGLDMRIEASGYGAGTRADSVLRISVGERSSPASALGDRTDWRHDDVWELRCQVDDLSGEALAFAMQELMTAGALDAYAAPILMKKGRPAYAICVLCDDAVRLSLLDKVFAALGTLGVRQQRVSRVLLARELVDIQTRFGSVQVKLAGGRPRPEYEDCARIARERDLPFHEVYEEVLRAAQDRDS